jgi:hypothetical protein
MSILQGGHRLWPRIDAMELWHNGVVRNFHVPLSDAAYESLRAVAERSKIPATTLAREAIDFWLRQQLRKARHTAIAAYAAELAGTALDLDPELEAVGVEHLIQSDKKAK